MSATCPNCNNVLNYGDLSPQINNMAQSEPGYFEMDEYCPKCGKNIVLQRVGFKYSMKEANGDFVTITHS